MHWNSIQISQLFDLEKTLAKDLLKPFVYPWEALPGLSAFIAALGATLPQEEYNQVSEGVWISKRAVVAPSASIAGPCVIDHDADIRHCAFVRGSVLVGKGAVVGNSTELKNCLLFDGVQVPHFNYVGDSILGYKAHMGAGAITSNVKSDKTLVQIRIGEERLDTGLKKLGAMLGDYVEVGCNSVLCPGSVIGRHSIVYPTTCVRGVVPCLHILKSEQVMTPRRDQ